ncbi:hypothetical protein CLAFUW4_10104 [Fulvia fulva]|uniref:NADP-dependent oxidoreductase domain-containing protein n=1 Tax=Passalora fulva TaxID=5499 RepID=A0A9Q8P8E4_PASFU|nr:uncharacterized protein CLAFUR5_04717 [Fulvia fulva]KAK4615958.1 hypothetical protein CLAFUR4_10108 [Fulvia fulva]KAK4617232.1 hypothetical protein CLAFUR0_10106 [Fulvia fulva]UJO16922.1 hypothetical protein CLAFUR5_04717 [Fulvia fulva]WPV19129.1 hypothetical protein CLAFUW4_10104 [Fulvia fulva]WPV34355.1 hypothetical protein CLAFUW7_10105 [Fulvia fulva]
MAKSLSLRSTLKLKSGAELPQLGFGVWDSPNHLTTKSCLEALQVGYRHIDTAQVYGNEAEVGEAIKKSDVPRKDLFITSKVLAAEGDEEATYQKCLESVKKIDGDNGYLDLLLIHNGQAQGAKGIKALWPVMEKLHQEGKLKSIGVSNTGVGLIESMKEYAKVWPPHVNQLELHPWCQQREVVDYCHKNGIAVEAYCPLVRNKRADDKTLKSIAEKHGKSTAQVLLRYCLQKAWAPLPKSDNPDRIAQNANIYDFALSDEDVQSLDDVGEKEAEALVVAVDNKKIS